MRIAQRAKERKESVDSGERVLVGVNRYRRESQSEGLGEQFKVDPKSNQEIVRKYNAVREKRDDRKVGQVLGRLGEAAAADGENLLPHLIECAHAYATVGEMVRTLKEPWGEFQEPIRF